MSSLGVLASFPALYLYLDRSKRTLQSTSPSGSLWNLWKKSRRLGGRFPRPGCPTPLACLLPGEGSWYLLFSQPGGLPVPTLPHEWGTSPPVHLSKQFG